MNSEYISSAEIAANRDAWGAFSEAMAGRQYGPSETLDAWVWFLEGYRRAHLPMAAGAGERRGPSKCTATPTGYSPPWFTGRWRDWHRGHGCELDDGLPRSPEAQAEIEAAERRP